MLCCLVLAWYNHIMATNKQIVKSPTQMVADVKPKRSRESVMSDICELLAEGKSLEKACKLIDDAPTVAGVLGWVEKYPELGKEYADARAIGYRLLADKIMQVSAETHSMVTVHAQDSDGNPMFNVDGTPMLKEVLVPLSADVMASKRLQVDTMKWMLAKMLPKVYGDKLTTEHTGVDGGAIKIAAMDFKGLSDKELEQMQQMMLKAAGGGA